jgi:Tfp pilus assembly protein PilO
VRELAILAMIALLFVAVILVMRLAQHHREMEERLDTARSEMDALRHRLAEATRPPTQFARTHLRESAVYRFARLRRAVPRRTRAPSVIERVRDLSH